MKLSILILVALSAVISVSAQKYVSADKAIMMIPAAGASEKDFVPEGWETLDRADGDLNNDGRADAALTLDLTEDSKAKLNNSRGGTNKCESPPYIVLILFAKSSGAAGYERFAANGKLYPQSCEDAAPRPTIKNGVLIVNHNWRDGWAIDTTFRFRYDAIRRSMNLIGFDFEHYNRASIYEGSKTSDNYLTGLRIISAKDDVRCISAYREVKRERIEKSRVSFENTMMDDPDSDDFKPFR